MVSNLRKFHKSILEYIFHEISSNNYTDESLEALGIARQCLETAWKIETIDKSDKLLKIFNNMEDQPNHITNELTEQEKNASETLKCQGNVSMAENLYEDAVSCYTKAIEINGCNPVYYCNRAAAYSNLSKHELAIEDCDRAIAIDSKYVKAYSRKGLAFVAMNKYADAKKCYKKALKLDPTNENCKTNLRSVKEKLAGVMVQGTSGTVNYLTPAERDLENVINNGQLTSFMTSRAFTELIPRLMSNPGFRDMLIQFTRASMGEASSVSNVPTASTNPTLLVPAILENLGQMSASNPNILTELNQIFGQQTD